MKQIKTLFFVLLTLALVLSLGICAAAEGGDEPLITIVESGDCGADGSDVQYKLYSDGLLEITGTGIIKSSAFEERTDILQVTIGENVSGAGLYAFNHCLNLESVTLPRTFQTTIGDNFYYCPSMKRFVVDADSPYLAADSYGCLYSKDMTGLIKFPAGTDATAYTIPDTVTTIHCSAFNYCAALQSITVPDSVTTIEPQAFDHCTALEQVNIPAGVTYFGVAVFEGCHSLKQFLLPDCLTEIPMNTFAGCGLESVVIPENITKIGDNAFGGCESLSALELHDGITEIGWGAFGECHSLRSVVLPKYITEIKPQTFVNDTALEEITIPYGVRTIGRQAFGEVGMFGCEALTKVHVMMSEETWNQNVTVAEKNDCLLNAPLEFLSYESDLVLRSGPCGYGGSDLDVYTLFTDGTLIISGTSLMDDWTHASRTPWADLRDSIVRVIVQPGVTSFGPYAFMYTPKLESVVLPEGITYIGAWAFCGCEKLTSINIPSTVRNIYGHAFQGCKGLKTIDMQSSKITTINYCTFNGCSKLETVTLPPTLQGFSESSFSDCFALREINIPDGVVTIGVRAFGSCRSLENLILPDSVTTIKNGAFQGCSKVNPPKLPANLQTLEDLAFAACNFESVLIPAQLTVIPGRAFAGNPNLTSVEIPAYVEGLASSAFAECKALTAYTVAPENQNYKSIDGVLFTKDGKTLLDYPAAKLGSAYAVPDGVTELANEAFDGCKQLTDLALPEGLTTIGDQAFSGCSGLTDLQIPQGVTSIGGAAFRGCAGMERIELPDTLESLGFFAFECCNSLRSLTLPATLTSMGHYAFNACQNLEKVTFYPALTQIPEGAFYSCDALSEIHYVGTIDQWLALSVNQYGNDAFKNAAVHIHDDYDSLASIDSAYWTALPTSDAGLQKGALYLDFTDAVKEAFPAEQQNDALTMLNAGNWFLDADSMTLRGALTLPAALYEGNAGKQITWYPSRDVLALALREAGVKWIALPYGDNGLKDGDWYLDLDAFVDAIGRGKTDEEKAEARAQIEQHVVFSYNPGGDQYVYKFEYTDLPGEDGTPDSGTVILPLDLTLGSDDAFPYDYNALQQCVRQYHAPAPDEPEQSEENENWFQKHIVGPLRSAIATILSFFRRLFGKRR